MEARRRGWHRAEIAVMPLYCSGLGSCWCGGQPGGAVGWRLLDGNNERASAWARRSSAAASRRRLSFVINCYRVWRRPKTCCADPKPLHPIAINTGRCSRPACPPILRPKTGHLYEYQMIGFFHDLHQLRPSWKETIRGMPNTQVYLIHLLSSVCPPAHLLTCPFAPCPFDLAGSRWRRRDML